MAQPILLRHAFLPALLLAALADAPRAEAGGGPQNLVLVVNALSEDSKTIANHYIRRRDIPSRNVIYLRWSGNQESCRADAFRQGILRPVLSEINKRGLALQTDYLVYSAGFPWKIDFKDDFKEIKFPRKTSTYASLTGATYLWESSLRKDPTLLSLRSNWYVPKAPGANTARCAKLAGVQTRGFRGRYRWLLGGVPRLKAPNSRRYLLCTSLGVTTGRGNSREEILAYLNRAALADHTQPDGVFYYAKNDDIRSKTRDRCFQGVVQALQAEGARAKVVQGVAPEGAQDVLGLTSGHRFVDLVDAKAKVLPGAICEHFTSYGGDLRTKAHQMPLSDFLRHGAAGACGTVVEPTALQAKFPLPSIHLHYYRGCSLAESFYQSVEAPYQLLIVGDPLCQPWAQPPTLTIDGPEPGSTVSGVVELTPRVSPAAGNKARPCEVYLDGRLYAPALGNQPFALDTTGLSEGSHEVRFVATASDRIEAQSQSILPFVVDNDPQQSVTLTASPSPLVSAEGNLLLSAIVRLPVPSSAASEQPPEAGQADAQPMSTPVPWRVVFRVHHRQLGEAVVGRGAAQSVSLRVPAKRLGLGPVPITVELVPPPSVQGQATVSSEFTGPGAAISPPVWVVVK